MEPVLIIIGIAIYFIPTMVASNRMNNSGAILLNIFMGWTGIGWVAALIWAASLKH